MLDKYGNRGLAEGEGREGIVEEGIGSRRMENY